jgi:signal transduction histidine kinase/ActR/RegA family two-component response regulator
MGHFYLAEKKAALHSQLKQQASAASLSVGRELESQKALLSLISDSPRLDPPVRRRAFDELTKRFLARNPVWEMIHIADAEAKIRMSMPNNAPDGPLAVIRNMKSFEEVLASRRAVVGSVFRTTHDMAAFPVRTLIERNGASYVLSVLVRPEAITEILFQDAMPAAWHAWVVDGEGRLVAATQASPAAISRPVETFFKPGTQSEDGISEGTLSNGEVLHVAGQNIGGSDWAVRVAIPAELYENVGRDGYWLLVGAVLLIITLVGLAVVLIHHELAARRKQEAAIATMQKMDALGKLTGGVAHDFNNLLMVFQGAMEGMKRRRFDDAKFPFLLDLMADGISRGKAMTQRLLSFSRRANQETETLSLKREAPALEQLVRQAVTDQIIVDVSIHPDIWSIDVDRQGFEVALINLATNARDAMPEGGRLFVEARNIERPVEEGQRLLGPHVALVVRDQGTGIQTADLDRVFEPFFTTKGGRSNGLGLSQVYGFAQRNNGTVRVDSVPGEGASFTLYLPKSRNEVAEEEAAENSSAQHPMPRRVLVVDDTPASLEACTLALEVEGVQVITATDGLNALGVIAKDPTIAYVLSDVMMPHMSGLELADRLRQNHRRISVVLMTGYSDALEAGHRTDRPVVSKPFDAKEVALAFKREDDARVSEKVVVLRQPQG